MSDPTERCTGCSHSKLTEALKLMRRRGLLVFRDLRGCAGCSAEVDAALAKGEAPARVLGAAFYTLQDAHLAADAAQRRASALKARALGYQGKEPAPVMLWLSFRGSEGSATEVGTLVLECLREAGLTADWNADPRTRVCVYL
jgi:hypothetical protein